jgi:hypothetical protein
MMFVDRSGVASLGGSCTVCSSECYWLLNRSRVLKRVTQKIRHRWISVCLQLQRQWNRLRIPLSEESYFMAHLHRIWSPVPTVLEPSLGLWRICTRRPCTGKKVDTRHSSWLMLFRKYFPRKAQEARLYMACVAAIVLPVSMFIYAWTASPNIPWIVPLIALTVRWFLSIWSCHFDGLTGIYVWRLYNIPGFIFVSCRLVCVSPYLSYKFWWVNLVTVHIPPRHKRGKA